MKGYTSETIRNVALLGHGGCGKTTFLEAALLETYFFPVRIRKIKGIPFVFIDFPYGNKRNGKPVYFAEQRFIPL